MSKEKKAHEITSLDDEPYQGPASKHDKVPRFKPAVDQDYSDWLSGDCPFSDCSVIVGSKTFKTHRLILCSRSEYANIALHGHMQEARTGVLDFTKDIQHAACKDLQVDGEVMMKLLYTGALDPLSLADLSAEKVMGLMFMLTTVLMVPQPWMWFKEDVNPRIAEFFAVKVHARHYHFHADWLKQFNGVSNEHTPVLLENRKGKLYSPMELAEAMIQRCPAVCALTYSAWRYGGTWVGPGSCVRNSYSSDGSDSPRQSVLMRKEILAGRLLVPKDSGKALVMLVKMMKAYSEGGLAKYLMAEFKKQEDSDPMTEDLPEGYMTAVEFKKREHEEAMQQFEQEVECYRVDQKQREARMAQERELAQAEAQAELAAGGGGGEKRKREEEEEREEPPAKRLKAESSSSSSSGSGSCKPATSQDGDGDS